jgi:hypothetical protein
MYRNIKLAVLTALPVAALSVCALAQDTAPTTTTADSRPSFFQHMLQKMDTNGDGRISLDEYLAAAAARFKGMDTQNRGSIDAAAIASSPETVEHDQRGFAAVFLPAHAAENGHERRRQDFAG